MSWTISTWDEATGRGSVTSDIGELAFDSTVVEEGRFFDGFYPGDNVHVTLSKSATGYVVTSLKQGYRTDLEIARTLAGGATLTVLPQQEGILPVKMRGAAGVRWMLFFDPLHVDVPATLSAVTRFEWRGWDEIEDEEPGLAERWGVDPAEVGGEIASFYDAAGASLGHVLFANSFMLWRRSDPPPGISDSDQP